MNPDILIAVFSITLSCLYTIAAWLLPNAPIGNPIAPKLFPLMAGCIGLILGVFLLCKALRKNSGKKVVFRGVKLNISIISICVMYAIFFEKIGFVLSTLLFLGMLLLIVNGLKKWKMNTIVTLSFTFATWYIFKHLFYINLP